MFDVGLGLSGYVPLVAYSLGLAAAVGALVYRTEIGLYFLVPLIPMLNLAEKLQEYPFGKDIVDLLVLAMVLGVAFRLRGSGVSDPRLTGAVVGLLLVTYAGLWVGSFKLGLPKPLTFADERLVLWKNYALMPILYFLTLHAIREKRQIVIVIGLIAFTMLMVDRNFYSTYQWVRRTHFSYRQRATGPFTYLGPNELAAFIAQYTMLLFAFVLYQRKWIVRGLLAGVVAANTYCVAYLFSRGAYLAVAVGLVFFGLVANRKLLVVALVLFVAWKTLLPVSVVERMEMTGTEGEVTDTSVLGRFDLWTAALDIIARNPIVGVGFGGTPHLGLHGGGKARNDVHNGFLEVALETGFVGLFCLLFIFYHSARKGWRLFRSTTDPTFRALGLGIVAVIIASLSSNLFGDRWSYLPVMGYFWILLGLTARAQEIVEREANESAEPAATGRGVADGRHRPQRPKGGPPGGGEEPAPVAPLRSRT